MANRFTLDNQSGGNPLQGLLSSVQAGQGFRQNQVAQERSEQMNALEQQLVDAAGQEGYDPLNNPAMQKLAVLNPKRAASISTATSGLSNAQEKSFFRDAQKASGILNNQDIPMTQRMGLVHEFAEKRRNKIAARGGDTTDTDLILQAIESGNLQEAQSALGFAVKQGKQAGHLKLSQEEVLENKLNQERNKTALKNQQDLRKRELDQQAEFKKEERAAAKQGVFGFNKRASSVVDSYTKIEKVLKPKNLNRRDISVAITALARLVSPGIVTEQDFQSLTGVANPLAQLFERMRANGAEGEEFANSMQQFYDPTNPNLFDREGFMRTVRNTAGGEIPSLMNQFNDARSRAQRAGVSGKALSANFDDNLNFKELQRIAGDSGPQEPPPQTLEEKQAELAALMARAGGQ